MKGLELLYRGSLKSCNYQCSYCPFSRHRMSQRELLKDQEQWEYFTETVLERAEKLKIRSLMVVPYGEALIHSWYWDGLGRISAASGMEAVGAQTNLSFSVLESLERFQKAGGDLRKLHLWATFHPEMTLAAAFSEKCTELSKEGIRLCAGAVGVPQNMDLLKRLRAGLPKELYLWINQMDGLKRPYTQEETEAFLEIDPCFLRELADVPADPEQCRNRLFVEGNGRLRTCNISRNLSVSWDGLWAQLQESELQEDSGSLWEPPCGKKRCSCYLAYGGRADFMNEILFGPHPLFRVPKGAKAVFLDIMGTLMSREESGQEKLRTGVRAGLEALYRSGTSLFFATTLPYQTVRKRCREIWHLFSGGIFAGGAYLVLNAAGKKQKRIRTMAEECLPLLENSGKIIQCRIRSYRSEEGLYKITLLRPEFMHWQEAERREILEVLHGAGLHGIRVFTEENCLQVQSEQATKEEGVRWICRQLHISLEETAAAGDSAEDAGMLRICQKKDS